MKPFEVYKKRLIYGKIVKTGKTIKVLKNVSGVIKFKKIKNEWVEIGELNESSN